MSYAPITLPGFDSGLVTNIDDSLIPNDAQASLINAYSLRKRLLKKGGYTLFGRLGRRQDTIAGAGGTLSYNPIEPGSLRYVEGANTHCDTPTSAATGTIAGGTINYTTGVYAGLPFPGVMTYIVLVDDYSPAMGISERELRTTNEEECIAFDRKMAYQHNGTNFDHIKFYVGGTNTVEWTGEDHDFFHTTNYYGSFWATNDVPGLNGYAITNITQAATAVITVGAHAYAVNDIVYISGVVGMTEINGLNGTVTAFAANTITVNINSAAFGAYTSGGFAQALTHTTAASGDGIRWYAGSGWVNFAPSLSSASTTPYLQGAKFILPFKDRLLCLNTWEGTNYANRRNYYNRLRWCGALATPYYSDPVPTGYSSSIGTWYQEPGGGGYLDAPTEEEILGVHYLKDYLLVLFERSAYIITYTGNRNLPFQFQKMNTDFGCESPDSTVSFDDSVLAVGNRGIYSFTSTSAERIDEKIPDIAFEMQNNLDGVTRIHGIRNFFPEVVFWTYRSLDTVIRGKFPNKVLVHNYEGNSWAIFNNSFTCFGNHITTKDIVWDDIDVIWDDYDVIWDDARTQSNNPTTLAGNQQGYVFALDLVGEHTINGNSISLSIESMTVGGAVSIFTCINHNLEPGTFVIITDIYGVAPATTLNNSIYKVAPLNYTEDTFTLQCENDSLVTIAGGYYCGGKITPLDNFEIVSKSFNPALETGGKVRYGMVDLLVNCNNAATVAVDTYVDKQVYPSSSPTISQNITIQPSIKRQTWHRTFPQSIGQFIQVRMSHPNSFMFSKTGTYANARTGVDIILMQIWFSKAGRNMR